MFNNNTVIIIVVVLIQLCYFLISVFCFILFYFILQHLILFEIIIICIDIIPVQCTSAVLGSFWCGWPVVRPCLRAHAVVTFQHESHVSLSLSLSLSLSVLVLLRFTCSLHVNRKWQSSSSHRYFSTFSLSFSLTSLLSLWYRLYV